MYNKLVIKKVLIGFILFFLLCIAIVISLKIGEFQISLYNLVTGKLNEKLKFILLNIRLTRTAGALITGAAIGVSGAVLQNILKNPLASPFTLGVSQGAAFGATLAIVVFKNFFKIKYLLVLSAFSGSLIAILAILFLATLPSITSESIILSGVALGAFFNAGIMFLKYFANDIQVASAVFWTFGDLSKATWENISIMILFLVPILIFFLYNSWNYNAFIWGKDVAKSLGVNVKLLTVFTLVFASLISSVCTAFLGIIGFIGLIAPHFIRIIIGSDYRFLIPLSAINGAFLLLLADIISRIIIKPIVLPVGIITSFAGVPLFLYIMVKSKRG